MRAMKLSEPVPGSMRQIRLAAFSNNRARRVLSCAFPTRRSSTTALLRFQGAESGDSRGAAGARSQQFAMARGYYCSLTTALCNEHGSILEKVRYRYVSSASHRGLHNVGNKNGIGRGRSPFGTVLIGCRHVLEPNVTVGSTAAAPAAPAARCLPQLAWLQTDAASGRCDGDGSSTQNKSNKDGQSTSHGDVKVGRGGANGSNPNRDRRADEDGWGTADDEAKQRGEGASAEKDQEAGGAARLNAIRDKLRDVGVDATEDAKDWIRERRDGVDEMKEALREARSEGRLREELSDQAKERSGRLKILWRKYGAVGIGCYVGIYVGSIGVFYAIYDYGLLTSIPTGGAAVIEKMQEWMTHTPEWSRELSDRLFNAMASDHRARSFVLAWATSKVIEPLRLVAAIGVTPTVARALGRAPAKGADDDDDDEVERKEESCANNFGDKAGDEAKRKNEGGAGR